MELRFTKMQGCANDYIYLDCRAAGVPQDIAGLAQRLSARRVSVGADGIVCICRAQTPGADAMMRIFNADGSEAKMCGNGIRCVAQWLREHDEACADKPVLRIDTHSGEKTLEYRGSGHWRVAMGRYSTQAAALPAAGLGEGALVGVPLTAGKGTWRVTCVSVGNPHCVTRVEDVQALKLEQLGPAFETHACFPEGVNTEFIQVVDPLHLKMRVWERGSGETWACGTGACAAVAAMTEEGLCPCGADVQVALRGGVLTIRVDAERNVWMTGPAVTVYEGTATV